MGETSWNGFNASCLPFSRKEVRELGLVILVDARKSLAAPALTQALAALQVSRSVCPGPRAYPGAGGVSGPLPWCDPGDGEAVLRGGRNKAKLSRARSKGSEPRGSGSPVQAFCFI